MRRYKSLLAEKIMLNRVPFYNQPHAIIRRVLQIFTLPFQLGTRPASTQTLPRSIRSDALGILVCPRTCFTDWPEKQAMLNNRYKNIVDSENVRN